MRQKGAPQPNHGCQKSGGALLPAPESPIPPPLIIQVARPHAPPGVSTERPMQLELTDR